MSPLVLPSVDMQFHSQSHNHSVPKIICQEEEEGDEEDNKSTLWSDMQEEEEDEEEELIRMMMMHSQSQSQSLSQSHSLSRSPSHSCLHSSDEETIEMNMNLFTIEEDPWAEKMAEMEQDEEYSPGLSQEHSHRQGHNRYGSTMKRRGYNPIIQQSHLFLSHYNSGSMIQCS